MVTTEYVPNNIITKNYTFFFFNTIVSTNITCSDFIFEIIYK